MRLTHLHESEYEGLGDDDSFGEHRVVARNVAGYSVELWQDEEYETVRFNGGTIAQWVNFPQFTKAIKAVGAELFPEEFQQLDARGAAYHIWVDIMRWLKRPLHESQEYEGLGDADTFGNVIRPERLAEIRRQLIFYYQNGVRKREIGVSGDTYWIAWTGDTTCQISAPFSGATAQVNLARPL